MALGVLDMSARDWFYVMVCYRFSRGAAAWCGGGIPAAAVRPAGAR